VFRTNIDLPLRYLFVCRRGNRPMLFSWLMPRLLLCQLRANNRATIDRHNMLFSIPSLSTPLTQKCSDPDLCIQPRAEVLPHEPQATSIRVSSPAARDLAQIWAFNPTSARPALRRGRRRSQSLRNVSASTLRVSLMIVYHLSTRLR